MRQVRYKIAKRNGLWCLYMSWRGVRKKRPFKTYQTYEGVLAGLTYRLTRLSWNTTYAKLKGQGCDTIPHEV